MKNIKDIFSIVLIISFVTYSSCKKKGTDPQPDPLADRLEELINNGSSWEVSEVTKDGYDVTDQFNGFTLTIGEFTYTTTNALESAWSSSGTCSFLNNDASTILRDDDTIIDVGISGGQLTLTFSVDDLSSGGRLRGINGDYQFVMLSQ